MPKPRVYTVELSLELRQVEKVKASSPEEAVQVAQRRAQRGFTVQAVESSKAGWDVIGPCEACSVPLLDDGTGRSYRSAGEDGGYLCLSCYGEVVKAAEAEEKKAKRCGARSALGWKCDLPRGHAEEMHASHGDGFYAAPRALKGRRS
jgi:hypothetical protein